jgi:hypothetical protein
MVVSCCIIPTGSTKIAYFGYISTELTGGSDELLGNAELLSGYDQRTTETGGYDVLPLSCINFAYSAV